MWSFLKKAGRGPARARSSARRKDKRRSRVTRDQIEQLFAKELAEVSRRHLQQARET